MPQAKDLFRKLYSAALQFGKATPEGVERAAGYSSSWREALSKGDIPFDPAGGLVSTGARAVGKGVVGRWKDVLSKAIEKKQLVKDLRRRIGQTFGEGRQGLPILKSTEEALTFGADWAGDQRIANLLKKAIKETDVEWQNLRQAGKRQAALEVGQEGALYRETLGAVEGTMPETFLTRFGYEGYKMGAKPTQEAALREELKQIFGTAKEDIRQGMIKAFSRK